MTTWPVRGFLSMPTKRSGRQRRPQGGTPNATAGTQTPGKADFALYGSGYLTEDRDYVQAQGRTFHIVVFLTGGWYF